MNQRAILEINRPRFHLPVMRGVIERRILVNFRCEPAALAGLLPKPFRPKLVKGWGMAGICLIRLGGMALAFMPMRCGLTSENAAHRIAVEWDEDGLVREGVFIPRRDTNALLNRLAGGTIFPGVHQAANFSVVETGERFEIGMKGRDGRTRVQVCARLADGLPADSVFGSLAEASEFFRAGALGWSAKPGKEDFDGLELHCREWRMEPLVVDKVESNFFGDRDLFPNGSAVFDCALLMRNIPHEWHARGQLRIKEMEVVE